MNSADIPMTIEPAGSRAFARVCTVLISALLTSAMWYWLLTGERALQERLLSDRQARLMRVERLIIQYASGAKSTVEIEER